MGENWTQGFIKQKIIGEGANGWPSLAMYVDIWICCQRMCLLSTKMENASTPSLLKIMFGLRFRLRNSGIKTIKRRTMKLFLKQSRWYSRLVLAGLRRQLSENDSLSSNYSPHWLHFSPMRETTIEEMCECALLCVCMHMYVHWASFWVGAWVLSHFYICYTLAQVYLLN